MATADAALLPGPVALSTEDDSLYLATPCFVAGDPLLGGPAANIDAFVGFSYGANGIAGTNTPTKFIVPASAVGSVWGVAYKREARSLYTAAMLKRHCGLGPAGMSGLYRVNISTIGSPVVSAYDLKALFNVNAGANPRSGTYPSANALPANGADPSHDVNAFGLVGKRGFGGIAMSADERTLYLLNLDKRQIEVISLDASGAPVAAGTPIVIPDPGCSNGDFRPWALKQHQGKLLVGTVCSAETGQNRANLEAFVQVFDGSAWSVLKSFPLTYTKGRTIDNTGDQNWYAWTSTWPTTPLVDGFATIYPQPIFSDIEVDNDGSLVLAFIDRFGHQGGYCNYKPDVTNTTDIPCSVSGGDVLRLSANTNTNTYDLESNGLGFNSPNTKLGQGNTQGPGGGEFYWSDYALGFVFSNASGGYHKEISSGGLAFIPGKNEVVLTALDPFDEIDSGGVVHLNNASGGRNFHGGRPGYRLYKGGTPYAGKATGIGDVVAFAQPSIELGDRVWMDTNRDGLQNAGEAGISGVSVCLYTSGGTPVNTTYTMPGEPSLGPITTSITGASGQVYTSPVFTNPAGTVSTSLTLLYRQEENDTTNADFRLEYSTDGGTTWASTVLHDYPTGDINGFQTFTQPALPLAANRIRVRRNGGGSGDKFTITNMLVTPTQSVTKPVCATTDAAGRYSIMVNSGEVTVGGSYELRVALAQTPLAGLGLSGANQGGDDGLDTDASISGVSAVIPLTMPALGSADLTFDYGFRPELAVGNLIYRDVDNDGKFTPAFGDEGLNGVKVQIFASNDVEINVGPDGILGTSDDAPGGMTTANGGCYYFQKLAPGSYYIKVPATEFAPGSPLFGLLSSVGNGANSTADDNADENGIDDAAPATNGIKSTTFSLASNTQPENEPGKVTSQPSDHNSNLTIDLGFQCGELLTNGSFESGSTFAGNVSRLSGTNNAMVITNIADDPVTGIKGSYSVQDANNGGWWVQSNKAKHGNHYIQLRGVDNCLRVSEPSVYGPVTQLQNNVNYQICVWAANTEQIPSVLRFEFYDTAGGDYYETYFTLAPDTTGWSEAPGNTTPIPWQRLCARMSLPTNFAPATTAFFLTCKNFDGSVPGLVLDGLSICPDPTPTVGIGNLVFIDANKNGVADANEGVDNVVVIIRRKNGSTYDYVADTVTKNGGSYYFLGLDPGTYRLYIQPSQFSAGNPLYGMFSIPNGASGDDNVGENGVDVASPSLTGVSSDDILVSLNGAPTTVTGETGFDSGYDSFGDANVDLTVDFGFACPDILIDPATLPNGIVGSSYQETVTASAGLAPITFSISAGALPAWLSLSNSGQLTGTPTNETSATFTIKATDAAGCTGTRGYTIKPVCPVISLVSNPAQLPVGSIGTSYSASINASGGTGPYTYTIKQGVLPAGLELSTAGVISGIPTGPTITSNFTITATDTHGCKGEGSFTIGVDCSPLTISPGSLAPGIVGANYTPVTLTAGGATGAVVWSLESGALPPGISFDINTGAISGIPTASGLTQFSVRATDTFNCTGIVNLSFTASCPSVALSPTTLSYGRFGQAYHQVISATGGTSEYQFSFSGNLPAGVTLAPDGVLSGIPTVSGSFNFIVNVTDAHGCTGSLALTLTIPIGSISGTVKVDTNGDDEGDIPLQQVILSLCNADTGEPVDNPNVAETQDYIVVTTGSNGAYTFTNLFPGNYVVKETQPENYISVSGHDTTDGEDDPPPPLFSSDVIPVTILAGENDTGNDFVERARLAIGNLVFEDTNGDGIFNGSDTGIDGVEVLLFRAGDDPNFAGSVAYGLTENGGCYLLETVEPGDYFVFIPADNFGEGRPLSNHNNTFGVDSSVSADDNLGENGRDTQAPQLAGVRSGIISLAHGAQPSDEAGKSSESDDTRDSNVNLSVDFGFVSPIYSIKGAVVYDLDKDQDFSIGDSPIREVLLSLYLDRGTIGVLDETDVLLTTQNTNLAGAYCFQNLPNGHYLIVERQPQNTKSLKDVVGADDNLIAAQIASADSTGNDFLEALDPQGYIYQSFDGKLVPGGTIDVSGPPGAAIVIILDGSTGEYSWIETNGTAGLYTMTYNPPAGFAADASRPAIVTPLDPTGLPSPHYVGSGVSGDPLCVTDHSYGANPWYDKFDLAVGDPLIKHNNIPLLPTKATNWNAWQALNPLGGSNGPTQNPDGDIYDNVQEFAFCLPADSGLNPKCPLILEMSSGGTIDATVTTVTGITGMTYTLEYITDLALSSANGGGWNSVNTIFPTATIHGDGTTTLKYSDLESLPGLNLGKGFVRVRLELASPAVTVRTHAAGWTDHVIAQSCDTFHHPFLKCDVFSGVVDGNTSTSLSIATSIGTGSFSAALTAGRNYYVEVLSGSLTGHRWKIVAGSSATSIAVGTGTVALLPVALVGSNIVVREAWSFGELFPPAQYVAGGTPTNSNKILLYDPQLPSKWITYFLADMTEVGWGIHWVRQGDNTLQNQDATSLDPCQGMFFHHRAAGVTVTLMGYARQNPLACPLSLGFNLVGGGYPVSQSPAGRAMAWSGGNYQGFSGGVDASLSDTLLFWKGDTTPLAENYTTYWLVDPGADPFYDPYRAWVAQGDNSLISKNATKLFKPTRAAFYKSKFGNADYVMPTGWIP